jgi:pyridoxamine 5'-phosphate oxidase family protein
MSAFTEREVEYLQQQRLGRVATVGADGQPHVVPVGFHLDPETGTIQIGSRDDLSKTKKFRDAAAHPQVTFVVDDMKSLDPPAPRGIEIRGTAEALRQGGERLGQLIWGAEFQPAWIRIRPTRIVSWGIEGSGFEATSRRVG